MGPSGVLYAIGYKGGTNACRRMREANLKPERVVAQYHAVFRTTKDQRDVAAGVGNGCNEVDPAEHRPAEHTIPRNGTST